MTVANFLAEEDSGVDQLIGSSDTATRPLVVTEAHWWLGSLLLFRLVSVDFKSAVSGLNLGREIRVSHIDSTMAAAKSLLDLRFFQLGAKSALVLMLLMLPQVVSKGFNRRTGN